MAMRFEEVLKSSIITSFALLSQGILSRIVVHLEDNPNRAWEVWSRLFLEICDFHAPKHKRKVRNNYAPWLTPEIKRLMFERDNYLKGLQLSINQMLIGLSIRLLETM